MNASIETNTAKTGFSTILTAPIENSRNKRQSETIKYYLTKENATYRILNNQLHVITFEGSRSGTSSMMWFWGNSSKAAGNYYYRSIEKRSLRLKELRISSYRAKVNEENEAIEKENRKILKKMQATAVEVGDIFSTSWGYEQTNVDFFQVVEKPSDQTAIVREIAHNTVPGSEGHDCCHVTPRKDSFLTQEQPRKVRLSGASFKVHRSAHATLTDEDTKHYKSWYY